MDLFSYVQSKAKVEKEGSDFYKVEPAPCCEHRQCAKLKDLGSNNWLYKCFSCGFSAKQAATLESKINNITYNEAVSKLKGHNVIKLTDPIAVLVEKNHKTLFNNPTYLNWLVSGRKLDPTVLKKFKVGCFKNKSGKVLYTFPYYKDHQILNIKTRSSDKSIVYQKKNAGFYIYNYNVIANTDSLLIVEGEMDLLAGYSYKLELPIISFGLGANNIKQEWIDELSHIKSIYLMYDMDDAGKQGRVELAKKLGTHRCKIIQLPHKDLNACLMNGVSYDVIIHCIQKSLLLDQLLIIEEIDRVQGEDTVVGGKLEGILNLIAQRPATESEDYLGKIRENIPSITYRQHLDFRRRIDQLRNLAPLTKEDNKKGNSNVMTNEDKSEALNLLKNKKLLETISTYFEELGLVGERENTMICFLSAVSRLMDDTPIHCLV
ncbi:MAG: toprim domain-containing protein, partial [Oligoflexales bacterium]